MKVGFIGLGTMGSSMAMNVLKGGHELVVHDINRDAVGLHLEAGAAWADTPQQVMEVSEVVFTSLPGPPEVQAVALGENGLLHKGALIVNGRSMWDNVKDAPCHNRDVITPFRKPFKKNTGIAVLRGNLCPGGAIIKPSAATPKLMKHKGRAVVFENIEDFHKRIDDPKLEIDEKSIMVLKNCGPRGYPGMAEVGNMPLPPKLLKKGITDMVRISDARMSGTAYGTVILHMVP